MICMIDFVYGVHSMLWLVLPWHGVDGWCLSHHDLASVYDVETLHGLAVDAATLQVVD